MEMKKRLKQSSILLIGKPYFEYIVKMNSLEDSKIFKLANQADGL